MGQFMSADMLVVDVLVLPCEDEPECLTLYWHVTPVSPNYLDS